MNNEDKKHFWEDLNEMIRGMPRIGKLFERGDFNRHIGSTPRSYDNVQGGFRF